MAMSVVLSILDEAMRKRDRYHTVKVVQKGNEYHIVGHYNDGKREPVHIATHKDAERAEFHALAVARMHNAYEDFEYND
jgi:hypothetical protein